jgi:nucleoside-diphosphate-sugar epimerase
MKYALLGATGAVGKALAFELSAKRVAFRVVGRSEERLRRDFRQYEPLVDYKSADLSDANSAADAVAGVETVLYTVGVPYMHFELHPKLSQTALGAAAAAGVRRFVHLSTVYPYGRPRTKTVDESHPRDPQTFKGRMRKQQEDFVLAADSRKECEQQSCGRPISTVRTPS